MPEQKLQFRNLKVPLAILVFAAFSAFSFYASYADTPYAKTMLEHDLALVCGILTGVGAAILTLGFFAGRAGYTQAGLDKIAEDSMLGKPPL